MPILNVTASAFVAPYAIVNGTYPVNVSKRRCLKFAISIGQQLYRAAVPTSSHAVALAAYKALAIKCAIDFTGANLTLPRPYLQMDKSEKANISFWTGMTFAAIIADEVLNVPRLIHVGAFNRMRLVLVNPMSRQIADLVGQDNAGSWHVIEAKARQNAPSARRQGRWKTQAQTIESIDGIARATGSYSLARVAQTYSAEIVDPPREKGNKSIKIAFNPGAIVKGYYGPLLEWIYEKHTLIERKGIDLVVRRVAFDSLDDEYVFIGVVERVMHSVKNNELPSHSEPHDLPDAYLGSDGIVVVTSKSSEIE